MTIGFVKIIVICRAILLLVFAASAYGSAPNGPESHRLPPDPGKAGKKTLMGIDSDSDGLRDDIQRYIYLTYPDQPNVQGALRQLALSLQKTLDPERELGTGRQLAKEIGSDIS